MESARRANIVEKILEQGQRLRNSMVKSILDTDPFYIDVVDRNSFNNSQRQNSKLSEVDFNQQQQEIQNGECLKLISNLTCGCADLLLSQVPTTMISNKYGVGVGNCNCEICKMYTNQILWKRNHLENNGTERTVPYLNLNKRTAHIKRNAIQINSDNEETTTSNLKKLVKGDEYLTNPKELNDNYDTKSISGGITKSIQDSYRLKAAELFKYVNSLKITLHCLTLNQAGNRKANDSMVDLKYKIPPSVSHCYFIEYAVPDCLINTQPMRKSKVDTGLNGKLFRICSKKLQNEGLCNT